MIKSERTCDQAHEFITFIAMASSDGLSLRICETSLLSYTHYEVDPRCTSEVGIPRNWPRQLRMIMYLIVQIIQTVSKMDSNVVMRIHRIVSRISVASESGCQTSDYMYLR